MKNAGNKYGNTKLLRTDMRILGSDNLSSIIFLDIYIDSVQVKTSKRDQHTHNYKWTFAQIKIIEHVWSAMKMKITHLNFNDVIKYVGI